MLHSLSRARVFTFAKRQGAEMDPASPDAASDETLLAAVASRQEAAFETLYGRHAAAVMAIVSRMVRDPGVAAEITQTTFLRLWSGASRIEPRPGRLRPWLITVGRNLAQDWLRRNRRMAPSADAEVLHEIVSDQRVEDCVIMQDHADRVRDVVSELPADQRLIIELAFFASLTQVQISLTTGIPLGTVKSRTRLGMQRLRTLAQRDGVTLYD